MNKTLLSTFLLLILMSCNSIRLNNVNNKTIYIKSNTKEKISIYKDNFKQTQGGINFPENENSSISIDFKNKNLKKYNFMISFNQEKLDLSIFDSKKKIKSYLSDNYLIEIYNVKSEIPYLKNLGKHIKYILITKSIDGTIVTLEHFSKSNDDILDSFLLDTFKNINISIR